MLREASRPPCILQAIARGGVGCSDGGSTALGLSWTPAATLTLPFLLLITPHHNHHHQAPQGLSNYLILSSCLYGVR
jgi:hypothetical protein